MKIFVRMVMMLFILSMQVSAADLSFSAQKIREGINLFDSSNYKDSIKVFGLAIRDYDSAIKLSPDDVESYINRGNFYCKHGKQDLAVKDYDKVLELAPKNFSTYK